VGYSFVIMNVIVSIYYIIVISYAIFYFVCSFSAELPWSHCGNPWNTEHCVDWRVHNVTGE
jgi:SNF family Na+-dependent transporter